jgi:hypothetical protein
VKQLINKERATRTDLPRPFPKSKWNIVREGCHYKAIESLVPETPDATNIFVLNQSGVIVDAQVGLSDKSDLKCPDKTLHEAELTQIVAEARATRKDVPAPFPKSRIGSHRQRCMYTYFEYRVPEARGDYLVFLIDPLGELVTVQRSQRY